MKQQRPTSDDKKEEKSQQEKEEKCMQCMYILHSGLNYMKKFKKSTTHWLKHTDAESQKWSEKTLHKNIWKMLPPTTIWWKNTSKI